MHEAMLERSWRVDARAAALVGVAHCTSHFFQMLLPPLFPLLMPQFGFSFAQAGFLATVFFVLSSCGQALAGFAVDRLGAVRMLLVGLTVLSAAGVALAYTDSYAGLVVVAALAGLGNAMFHPADFAILNRRVSPARLGHAFALHGLAGSLGWVAGTAFMGTVAAAAGWQAAGLGAAAVALGVAFLVFAQRQLIDIPMAHPAGARHPGEAPRPHLLAHLGAPVIWLCFAYFFLSSGAGGVLQNFAPSMLHGVYGVSIGMGTAALTVYMLGSATGTLVGGFLCGREARSERVIAVALGASALLALALAAAVVPPALLFPALFGMGLGAGTAAPNRDMLVRRAATQCFGAAAFGRVYGFVYAGLDGGLALAPLLVGLLLDSGHFRGGLLCVAALQVAAVLVAVRVGRRA